MKDNRGANALHYSMETGNITMVKKLLEYDLDINSTDDHGVCITFESSRLFNVLNVVGD